MARPIYPGVNLMLTRRVRGREFLLRPGKKTNRLVGYVLAVVANKWNIRINAVTVLSNHWHVVLGDQDGRVVDFQRDCHSFIARALNTAYSEVEAVWSSDPPSRVSAAEPDDLIDQIAYTMANPVEAGLVMHGSSWPGLRAAWPAAPKTFKRPSYFFRGKEKGGAWPAVATLELCRPVGYEDLSDDELAGRVEAAILEREEGVRREFRREGRRFLGRRGVLRQARHARAASTEPSFGISPRVAGKNKRARLECLQANAAWLKLYRAARDTFVAGDRDVVFPFGTYQMCVIRGARCAGPPD